MFTVKQLGLMLLFTFELKYTRMCIIPDATPFHVRFFPFYDGMTNLRVAQGDGLRIRKVGGLCRLNSCSQPTRCGPSVFGLGREKSILDGTKYANLNEF